MKDLKLFVALSTVLFAFIACDIVSDGSPNPPVTPIDPYPYVQLEGIADGLNHLGGVAGFKGFYSRGSGSKGGVGISPNTFSWSYFVKFSTEFYIEAAGFKIAESSYITSGTAPFYESGAITKVVTLTNVVAGMNTIKGSWDALIRGVDYDPNKLYHDSRYNYFNDSTLGTYHIYKLKNVDASIWSSAQVGGTEIWAPDPISYYKNNDIIYVKEEKDYVTVLGVDINSDKSVEFYLKDPRISAGLETYMKIPPK